MRFNDLYEIIDKDRETNGSTFDQEYLKHRQEIEKEQRSCLKPPHDPMKGTDDVGVARFELKSDMDCNLCDGSMVTGLAAV